MTARTRSGYGRIEEFALRIAQRLSSWELWKLPRLAIGYMLALETVVLVGIGVLAATAGEMTISAVLRCGVLSLVAVAHVLLSAASERRRRAASTARVAPHINLTSVWCYAGAVVLPPILALGLVLLIRAVLWTQVHTRPHRYLLSSATITAGCLAAVAVLALTDIDPESAAEQVGLLRRVGVLAALVLAAGAYGFVQAWTIGMAMLLASGAESGIGTFWGSREDNAIAALGLVAGAMLALAMRVPDGLLAPLAMLLLVRAGDAHLARQRDLEATAGVDHLTGLALRDRWTAQALALFRRTQTGGGHSAVLMIDLDHFKPINDTAGHAAGDAVLAAVASVLQQETRPGDLLSRWGGDEFVVLIPDVTATEALACAERIRAGIAALRLELDTATVCGADRVADSAEDVLWISASIGIAHSGDPGDSASDPSSQTAATSAARQAATVPEALTTLLADADTQAYASKKCGRNRVTASVVSTSC